MKRIAVFDNDGTLWPEMPMPAQAAFGVVEMKRDWKRVFAFE